MVGTGQWGQSLPSGLFCAIYRDTRITWVRSSACCCFHRDPRGISIERLQLQRQQKSTSEAYSIHLFPLHFVPETESVRLELWCWRAVLGSSGVCFLSPFIANLGRLGREEYNPGVEINGVWWQAKPHLSFYNTQSILPMQLQRRNQCSFPGALRQRTRPVLFKPRQVHCAAMACFPLGWVSVTLV